MIYTLTLNPSIDYIMGVENLTLGEVNRSGYEKILPGGKGINVSIVLKNLGKDSCAMGFIGGFTGNYIKEEIEKSGVKTDFVLLKNGISRINTKVKSHEETEINGMGPEISEDEKDELIEKLKKIKGGDILVLAGSVPRGFGKDFYLEIMSKIPENVKVVVDAEGDLLKNTLHRRPFLIKPNIFELCQIAGKNLENLSDIKSAAFELRKMGARNVLVSMGGDGALFVSEKNECMFCSAPKGKVVNSTGSGDSLVAGFLWVAEESEDFERAFLMGISSGSACAFSENLAEFKNTVEIYDEIKGNIECFD